MRNWSDSWKHDLLRVFIHSTRQMCRSKPRHKVKTYNLIPPRGSHRAPTTLNFQLKCQSRSTSVTSYLISPSPPVSDAQRDKHFSHSASPLWNVLFFSLWIQPWNSASVISVSLCWHGGSHREASPDYWTDVFNLAVSVDIICLRCTRGHRYTAALTAETNTLGSGGNISVCTASLHHS